MPQNTLITMRGTVRPVYAMVAAGSASPGPAAPAAADKPRDPPGAAGCSESLACGPLEPSRVTVTLLQSSFLFEALRGQFVLLTNDGAAEGPLRSPPAASASLGGTGQGRPKTSH